MAFCSECGARLPNGVKFCTACGTKILINSEGAARKDSSTNELDDTTEVSGKATKPAKLIIIICIVAAILAIGVIIAVMLLNKRNAVEKTVEETVSISFDRESYQNLILGTWGHVVSMNFTEGDETMPPFYINVSVNISFYKDWTGAYDMRLAETPDELKRKAKVMAKSYLQQYMEDNGYTDYLGEAFDNGVNELAEEWVTAVNSVFDPSQTNNREGFEYSVDKSSLYMNGGLLGSYYLADGVLYVKGGMLSDTISNFEGKEINSYIEFEKVR